MNGDPREDVWDVLDTLRRCGWCLELDNRGMEGTPRHWTARFTNWGRVGELPGIDTTVQGEDYTALAAIRNAGKLIAANEELARRECLRTYNHIPAQTFSGIRCIKCGELMPASSIPPHIPGWKI